MASRITQDFQAGAVDDLLYQMGEDVIRYPLGVESDAETLTAIVNERDATQDRTRGENNARTMRLQLAASDDVDPRDTWLIRGEVWSTTTVAGENAGMRIVNLKKSERQRTKPVGVN